MTAIIRRALFLSWVIQALLWGGKTVTIQKGEVLPSTRSSATPSRLLFPWVLTQSGFDTEITISNTSQDTSGSTPQAGTCTLNFFGPGAPPQSTTVSIAAGKQLAFNLSQGTGAIPAALNFSGYLTASCGFPLARGTSKAVAAGNLAFSQDAQVISLPRSTATPQRFLLPFATNQNGYDTGIAIANTSLDGFGTGATTGSCTLNLFGANAPAAPVSTGTIAAGSVYTNLVSLFAPNFQGYVTATCNFAGAAVSSFVSDAGARNIALTVPAEAITLPRGSTAQPLLFSSVTNRNGNDTGLAIANTSLDPFGTTPASGACTLNFFSQGGAPGPVVTASIAAGTVYTTLVSTITPGFQGYIIAVCPFAQARGWSFTAPTGAFQDGDSEIPEIVTTPRSLTPAPLLFSSATNWNGLDTSFTISNTSQDPFGTSQASGACTINYFGDMIGGGSPPPPQTSATIAPGGQLTFTLSGGNPAQGIIATPGFRGYVIANCSFPLARGVATVTAPGPTFSITKTHTGNFVQGQANATYTVTVSNAGAAGPTNGSLPVTVTETVPAGMTLVFMSGTGWTCPGTSANNCTRSDVLNPGASYPSITVTVNVAAGASSPLVNSVSVSGGGSPNASTTDSTVIQPAAPLLTISASHIGNFAPAQSGASYTVTVSNAANAGTTSGTVTVTETVPVGMTLVSMAGTGWTCPGTLANNCTRSDALAPGASYSPITVIVNVAANAGTPLLNSVAVSGGGSGGANASDSTIVVAAAALQCSTNISVTPTLRSEGYTEGTGDIAIVCTGGQALNPGSPIPQVNLTLTYNTAVTSRLLPVTGVSNNISEALLMLDEPGSGLPGYGPNLPQRLCPTPLSGCVQYVATATAGNVQAGQAADACLTFNAAGVCTATSSVAGQNVFQGVVSGNTLTFFGVPVLAPVATGATRVFRIVNARVNASALSGGPGATPVVASISVAGGAPMQLTNATPTVGFVQSGLTTSASASTNLPQCTTQTRTSASTLTFSESFPTAFKTRIQAQTNTIYAGQSIPGTGVPNQNVPGSIYNSESGFVFPIAGQVNQTAGLTDFGTRLRAVFNNIPVGMRLFVSTVNVNNNAAPVPAPPIVGGNVQSQVFAQLINSETVSDGNAGGGFFPAVPATDFGPNGGNVPIAEIAVIGGSATAIWEVINTNPNSNESVKFAVYATYFSNVPVNIPPPGTVTVNLNLAPAPPAFTAATGAAASSVLALPRFIDTSVARNIVSINLCAATLSIVKTHTGNFFQGQNNASYTVTVSNAAGGGSTSPATPVTVTETVPAGMAPASMAGTGWTCPTSGNTCTRSDVLVPGASYPPIAVAVNVAPNATSPLVNSVSVSGGGSATANATDSTVVVSPPSLSSLSPNNAPLNSGSLALTLTGTNFQSGATVQWTAPGGASTTLNANSVTATQIQVTVTGNLLTTAGTAQVAVVNPGGILSASLPFSIGTPVFTVGPSFGTWSLGEIQAALTATGGAGPYSWALVSGSLPPGIALRTDVPSFFPSGTAAGLIGVATTPGTYNFTLSVTSGGLTTSQACSMKITALNQRDLFSLPDAFVGVAYSYSLSAVNAAGPLTFSPTSTLPAGLSMSSAGLISGTPAVANNYNISYSINDGTDTVFRGTNLLVSTVRITSAAMLPNITKNSPYSFTVTASGGVAPYTFTTSGVPSGLTFTSAGVLSGTVTGGSGRFDMQITATDHNGASYVKYMSIDILSPPVTVGYISPYSPFNQLDDCTVGIPCSRGLNVWNGGTAPFTWSATGLPAGMAIRFGEGVTSSYIWSGDGEIWGTASVVGTFNVRVTVTDANGLATSETFALHVSPLEQYFQDTLPNGTRGTAYSRAMRVIGGTGAGYTVSILTGQLPAGLVLNAGVVSGTPTENGFFNPQLSFTDSGTNNLKITNYFNIAPTSNVNINDGSDLGQIVRNVSFSRQLSACCVTVTWAVTGGALPAGLSLSGGGLLSGTPTVSGTYTFTVSATQTGSPANFGVRVFKLVVTPLNFTNPFTLPFGNVGTPYSQTFAVTGASGSVTFAVTPNFLLPPGLTLNTATGVLSGTPSEAGQFLFNITATDSAGNTITRTFNIFIFAAGAFPPVAISTGANFGTWAIGLREQTLTATGGNGSYVWSFVSGTLPPGMSVRPDMPSFFASTASGCLCGVMTTPGTYSFTLMATSGTQSATQAFTVKVTALRLMDPGTLPDAFVGVAYSYTFSAAGNAGTVTWTATGVPAGLTLSPAGVLSGTPTGSGTPFITPTLNDGVDTVTSWFGVSLHVTTVRITSSRLLPPATQFQPYTATVTASGGTPPYTFTTAANALPFGFTLDSATGVLSGTTTNSPGRSSSFNLTVTDANHLSYTQTAAIPILGAPAQVIQIVPASDGCQVGNPCSFSIKATNGGTPPFTWSATGLPTGIGVRSGANVTSPFIPPGDGEVWGAAAAAGTYNVQFTVTDASGKASTQIVPLVVSPMTVEGVDTLPGGTRGVAYSKTLRVAGGTGPWSVQQVLVNLPGQNILPAGLSLSGMTVSGTPQENGSFGPIFLFHDSAGNSLQTTQGFSIGAGTSTISINDGTPLGPVVLNTTFSRQFSACCVPSYTWSFAGGTLPPGLAFSPAGVLSGLATTAGSYTFLIQAADATNPSNFGVKLITMMVTPVAIGTGGSLPFGNVGTFYTQTLTATGGTGAINWTLAGFNNATGLLYNVLPPGLTLSSAGELSGTPTQPGYFQFTLLATDASGSFSYRNFNVQFYAAGTNPPLGLNFGPTLGPNVIGVQTFQLTAAGGTPPYHFSYSPGATVIPGMRVLDGPPLPTSFPATTTGGFAGVVLNPGFYTTSLRVSDGAGATLDRPIFWTVLNSVPLSQTSPPKATVGTFYSFTFQPYGGSGNFSWTSLNPPPGLTLSPGGTISGIPTTPGVFTASVVMNDLTNIATGLFPNTSISFNHTFTINPFAITPGGVLPQGTIGQPYSVQLDAPNCGAGCIGSLAGGSLPSGITLSPSGLLSGTPTAFFNGGFLVQAAGANGTVQKEFSLRINFNTIQPLFISNGNVFGPNNVNSVVANSINVQGGAPPYTVTLDSGSLPPGISLTGPGDSLGANLLPGFLYLAGRTMQPGNYSFTLKAADANSATTTKAFTWTVLPISINITSFPVIGNPLTLNTAWSQQLLVLGGSGNYTSWQVVSGALPPGLSLNTSTGVVSGTPTNTGSFTAGIQVNDSIGSTTTQNVSFTVAGPTGVVLAAGNPDSSTIQLGNTTISTWNPSGGTGPYTYAPVTPYPPGCTIEFGNSILNGNTTQSYALACSPSTEGDYTFTFQITDSAGNIGIRTMTLHVVPFTLFSNTTLPNGSVGSNYSQTLLVWNNATTVNWSVVAGNALPVGMSIVGNTLTGTPTVAGSYSFTLAAQDASGLPVNFTFSLVISTIRITTPEIIPQQVFTNEPYSFPMTATGGGTKTWSATGLPAGITMSVNGTLSGTTTAAGAFRITVTVTDGVSSYAHVFTLFARFRVPTVPTLAVLSAQLADVRVGMNTSFTLSPTGGVPPFNWTLAPGSALPPGLSLYTGTKISEYSSNQTVGLTYIQGQPTTAGSYTFDLIATDAAGTQMRRTFTLKVSPMAIVGGGLRTPVTAAPYAEQFTVVGGTPPYNFTYDRLGINTDMLPPGFTASPSGLISGTTTSTGSFGFVITAHDSAGRTFTMSYSYIVTNALGLEVTTAPLFGARLGVGVSSTLSTNGTSTYTWSVSAGPLPPGLSLVPSGSTTLLAGTPQAFGTFSFTLRATDDANPANFADRAYTILIGPMMSIGFSAIRTQPPPARVGTPYSYTLLVAGGTPPYTFSSNPFQPLPPGLTLSPAGLLSGTPTAIGTYSFTYRVEDANGNAGYLTPKPVTVLGPGATNPLQGTSATFPPASVGVAFARQLDDGAVGGVLPFSWTVAPGSSLPPGVSILPGSNGVSSYLGGIPTSAGSYAFTLNMTDAAGQTGSTLVSIEVSPLSAVPGNLPNGMVGTPYSATLTPSGGTAPYTFAQVTATSMPPGLSLSPAGTLSGTPASPGFFTVTMTITDQAGITFTIQRSVVIDNAAGQARAVGITPADAIQLNYVLTAPAPAPIQITLTTTTGTLPFNAMVSGIPGATLSSSTGNAPATMNLTLNTAGLAAGTYAGVIAERTTSLQTARDYIHIPIVLNVTSPPPCTYTLTPNSGSVSVFGGTVSFGVSTGALCSWTASKTDPWITITSGSGTGPGTVSFDAAANGGQRTRTGKVTVAGQDYTVTQFGLNCAFSISPTSVTTTAAAGSATVNVTATNGTCAWTASGLGASPIAGSGNGPVTLNIPANASTAPQVLTATVAGQTFTVNQGGVNCTVSLGSSSAGPIASSGGTGTVNVSTPAGCTYNTVLGPGWINVTSGSTGSGPGPVALNFSVLANSTTTPRSGTLSIGGQSFTITQDPTPCSVTVDASALTGPFATVGGSAGINVIANGANCSWTASSGATWATLAPASGSGNGSVIVTALSNSASASPRSTNLTIAGQTIGVTQSGTTCTYSLGSSTASVPFGGGTGSVTVTAPAVCGWNSTPDPAAPWLGIASSGSAGTSDVTFTAAPNPNSTPRSGTLTVAGQSYTVAQGAAPCNYTLSNSNTTLAASGASDSFTFSTSATGCTTTALSYSSWLTATTNTAPGGTSGTVNFTATANTAGTTRTGTIQFGGQTFTVSQTGAACAYSLNAYGVLLGMAGGGGSVLGSPSALGCTPAVGTDQPSIVTLGALGGPVANIFNLPYTVTTFNSAVTTTRRMTITFGGQVFTVKQTSW